MAATTETSQDVESRLAPVLLVLIGVITALCVAIVILARVLPPDPGPISAELTAQFFQRDMLYPEPTERRIFLTALLLLPLLALTGARLARRPVRWSPAFSLIVFLLVALAVATLASNAAIRGVMGVHKSTTLVWAAALLALLCLSRAPAWLELRGFRGSAARWTIAAVLIIAAYLAFSWRTLDIRSLQLAWRHVYHLDAVLYTTAEAVAGKLPLVDYPSQYGFFGTILAPWFRAVGLSVLSFTLTMNALQLVAFGALIAFIFRQLRSLPLAVGACFAMFFFMGAWAPVRFDPDPYFQVMPVRFLFPAISVLSIAVWLGRPTPRRTLLFSLFAGVALVWNVDSGVAVAGSWLGLLGFHAAAAALRRADAMLWLKRMAVAAGGIAIPVLVFVAWLRLRAGGPVDFLAALESQQRFYVAGYYMLPMPLRLEAWQVVAAIYVCGFVLGSFHALGKIANDRAALILYLSFLGLGLFPYYQGRSHVFVLMAVAWPAVLIAILIADWAWTLSKSGRLRQHAATFVVAPTLAFGALCGLVILGDLPRINDRARTNLSGQARLPGIVENVAFLREKARGKSEIILLARFQGAYLAETGLASGFRGPGVVEVITRAQGEAIVREIEKHPTEPIFIGPPYLRLSADNPFSALLPTLMDRYELTATTHAGELRMYVPRAR